MPQDCNKGLEALEREYLRNTAASLEYKGEPYYALEDHIYTKDYKLIGYICSRGKHYAWGALDEEGKEFARGSGMWERFDEEDDPAFDALLAAHEERKE